MFTAIITAAWRGFGLDHSNVFFEIHLGLITFALLQRYIMAATQRAS